MVEMQLALLRGITIYTVGPATALALTKLHFTTILGADTGNGGALANLIVQSCRREQSLERNNTEATEYPSLPFLFLVGDKRRDIIPKRLGETNIPLEELTVYETTVSAGFDEELDRVLDDKTEGDVEWIVFFSPSGAEIALKNLERMARRIKIATIGPTTEEYLRKEWNLMPDMVAAKPEPISMVKGIIEHI